MGAEWFEAYLVDHDVCSNTGNWTYSAGVGTDPRARTFNIIKQAKDYDPTGEYIKMWVPELKDLPPSVIHHVRLDFRLGLTKLMICMIAAMDNTKST